MGTVASYSRFKFPFPPLLPPPTVLHYSTHTYIPPATYNRACRTSATAFMRVFLPVNVFISVNTSARCIEKTVSEALLNAGTFAYRAFGFYFSYYFWY